MRFPSSDLGLPTADLLVLQTQPNPERTDRAILSGSDCIGGGAIRQPALGPKDRHSIATSVRAWIKDLEDDERRTCGTIYFPQFNQCRPFRPPALWNLLSTPSRTWLLTAGPSDLRPRLGYCRFGPVATAFRFLQVNGPVATASGSDKQTQHDPERMYFKRSSQGRIARFDGKLIQVQSAGAGGRRLRPFGFLPTAPAVCSCPLGFLPTAPAVVCS
jgi:hypothetical protein